MPRHYTSSRPHVSKRNAKRICQAAVATAAILSGPIYAQNVISWKGDLAPGDDLWTTDTNWDFFGTSVLPGVEDTASFDLDEASNISLGGTEQTVGGLSFTRARVYRITTGSLILNSLNQTGNANNEIQVTIKTKNNGADLLTANVTTGTLQLQKMVTAGGITKTGAGTLRLGTSGTDFTNVINGDIALNGGTLQVAANNQAAGNPLGGTGNVVIGAAGTTLTLQAQANMDFGREVVANNNSFTLRGEAAAADTGDFTMSIGKISIGTATLTATTGAGYLVKTSELAISSGSTTTVTTNNFLYAAKLTGDSTTKIIKNGGSDLRIQANASNATDFQGDIDVAAGWLVLEGNGGGQPLGNANTQITITGAGSNVSLRSDVAQTFNGVNIAAGNNSFNLDVRTLGGTTAQTLRGGAVTIGNATMSVTGDRNNAALSSVTISPGATTIINPNSANNGAQNLRVDSLIGDATTTLQKNGGQTLTVGAGTDFTGKIVLNGGTTTIESTATGNILSSSQSVTITNGSTLNLRGQASTGFVVPIRFGPGVLSSTINADRITGSAVGKFFTLGDVNPSAVTLTLSSQNTYGFILNSLTFDAGSTSAVNVATSGTAVVNTLNLPANATFNKTGGSTMVLETDQSLTSSGAINVRAGTLAADAPGSLGTGLVTVGATTQNSVGYLVDASRLFWGATRASANNTGTDAVAVAGGVIDLSVIPDATDIFSIQAEGRIQGDETQLRGLTVGTNLTLAQNAIVLHDNPGATRTSVNGLTNDANFFYGIAANADSLPAIGAGTPWKGISSDNTTRQINGANTTTPAQIIINGGDANPDTIEATFQSMFGVQLNLGTDPTNDGTIEFVTPNSQKVTLAVRGVLGSNSAVGLVPGGFVGIRENATISKLAERVDKIVVQSGALGLMTTNALGGVAVEVQNGGALDIANISGNILDGPVNIKNGGLLFLNDNQLLGGTGAITIENGGKLDIVGAPANILTASTQQITFSGSGHTVRFNANNIPQLDTRDPDLNVTYVGAGGVTQSTAFTDTNLTGVVVNSQNDTAINNPAGLTIQNGVLTNGGSNTAYVGPIRLNDSGLTIAATRGTSFIIPGDVQTIGNLQIGSTTPIDFRDKSLNSSATTSLGVPDPYNGGSQVVLTGAVSANNVTVNNSHFAIANANTKFTGDLTVNGAVLYLDGGGPLTTAAPAPNTQGQLTPKLTAVDPANRLASRIILGQYSRVEIKLDLPSDSNATVVEITQPFVIDGEINPLDNRRFWISRNSGTNNRVNLNDVTLRADSVFGVQEDQTDIRANLKLAGNATASTTSANTNVDYLNISRDGSLPAYNGTNPVVLSQGRLNIPNWQGSNNTVSNVFGTIAEGVEVNLVRGQLLFLAGSKLDGVVRTQTAGTGGDAFVVSSSNSSDTTSTNPTSIGGLGRIELGRSAAANGPEDFEIRGTETTNAATTEAPLHTHTGEIRVVNDGDNTNLDGIVRSSRVNDSERTARVQVDKIVVQSGAGVQLTNANAIPLTVTAITLQGDGRIDTAATGMTVNTVDAGTNTVTFSGAQPLNLGAVNAGHVKVENTTLNIPHGLTGPLTVNGGNATTNGGVNGPVNVTGGSSTVAGNITGSLNVTTGTATFDASGGTRTVSGPVALDGGSIAVMNGMLDLTNTVITSTAPRTVAGLREGRVPLAFNLNDENTSNVVKLGPVMAQLTTGWGTNETYIYSGQFLVPNNNGDGTGTFAFAENFDDSVRVTIDGNQVLNGGAWNDANGTGELILPAGWHDVEFRFGQGTGGAGPNNNDGWNTTLGFGLDVDKSNGIDNNTASPVQAQYIAPLDNGSMNLFRTSVSSNLVITDGTLRTAGFSNIGKIAMRGLAQLNLSPTGGAAVASKADSIDLAAGASGFVEVTRANDSLTVDRLNLGGDLTVTGAGSVTVSENTTGFGNVYLGAETQQFTGTLSINGSANGAVVSGGTLRGNATFANITMNGGKLAPGQSRGLMTAGTLSAVNTAAFEFEIGSGLTAGTALPGVDFDQIVVSGDFLDLAGPTLSLLVSSHLQEDDVLTLILNNGPDADAGTFAGLTNGALINLSGGYQVQISYFDDASTAAFELAGGNDISVLVTIPEPTAAMALLAGLTTLAGMRRFRRRNS